MNINMTTPKTVSNQKMTDSYQKMTVSNQRMTVSNPRICRFYEENPGINFEAVNLIFIDLFDQLLSDINATMNATIQSQILSTVHENTQKINELNSSIVFLNDKVSMYHTDILNNITLKFVDAKKEYIQELGTLIQNNTSTSIDALLDKHNSALISKTTSIIQDIIPRSQTHYFTQIKEAIQSFHKSITDDTRTLLKHADNPSTSMKEYLNNFEMKSSMMLQNIQQPIYTFITASEERINTQISSLKDTASKNTTIQAKLAEELTDVLNGFRNSAYQTAKQTTQIQVLLSRLFNTSDVVNYSNFHQSTASSHEMSTFILKRNNHPKIVIQNIDVERNANVDEIKEFTRIIEHNNCSGIFFSQRSGFTNKPNFHIETHNKLVLMYVHNVDYSPDKIRMSIDILDNVFYKLCEIVQNTETGNMSIATIEKEVLEEINKEYQTFIHQKDTVMNFMKDTQKTLFGHIDDLKFPALDRYLSTKFAVTANRPGFKCDLCKTFMANNLKALAAHKRGCTRKISSGGGNNI